VTKKKKKETSSHKLPLAGSLAGFGGPDEPQTAAIVPKLECKQKKPT
jgi:hypothetical protein